MKDEKFKIKQGEEKEEYIWRMYENKIANELTNNQVRDIICDELNINVRESYLRGIAKNFGIGYKKKETSDVFDKTVMIINDVHLPFEREDFLEIIIKHANEIDTLVINGDFLDCHSISSFPQIRESSLKDEVLYGYDILKKIRKILNKNQKIIMNCGNHEKRYYSNISKMNEKDLQTFINPNILEMYTEGFTLYIDGKKQKYEPIENVIYVPHWYTIIDKMIVCHPTTFSQAKGKMLENVASHFINKGIDFNLVVFGHTHKYSCGIVERFANKFAIENPCLCKPQSYSDCGKTGYSGQSYGYTIVKYNKGEDISLNNCKTYVLDELTNTVDNYIIEI